MEFPEALLYPVAMKSLVHVAILTAALCAVSGCISNTSSDDRRTTEGDAIHITLLPAGTFLIGDVSIPRDQLVKALRKSGATPMTTLYVNIPKTLPLTEVSSLTQILGSGGYRRVFYKRPKQAEAGVIKP